MSRKNFDRLVSNYRTLQYWADLPGWVENGKYKSRRSCLIDPLKIYVAQLDKLLKEGTFDKKTIERLRMDLQWLRLEFREFDLGEAMPKGERAKLAKYRRPKFRTLEEYIKAQKGLGDFFRNIIKEKGGEKK